MVCVACSAGTQERRLRERGWSTADIAARLAAQWPVPRKAEASHFVVWNEGTLEALGDQLTAIVRRVAPDLSTGSPGPGTSPGSLT